jgi:cell division septation protein DedD
MHIGRPAATGMNEGVGLSGQIFSVQVASSQSREDSERLQQKFIALGYESYIIRADLGRRGIWYRVRVGNLATKEEAEGMRQNVLNRASHLVKDPYVIEVNE